MAGRFSVEAVFKAVDRITAPVKRMQNRVGRFTRSMERRFGKLNRVVGKFASGLKKGALAIVASLALTSVAMANVIGAGVEFEQTLVSAAAKFPGEIRKGTKAFKQLEDAARKTGATTEFTASQSAEALNFLAMAGFNASQSVAALPGVVDLATSASIDLATASDIATDSLGAFGLATKDVVQLSKNLTRVNDVLAKTTTTANVNMEDLFETVKKGGPVATSVGASIETFGALAGTMANSSLKASEAGSTLKNMFLRLAAPAPAAAKLLKQFGIQTVDTNGDLLDIIDILGDFDEKLKDLGTAEKAAILDTIFGKRAITGVNILLESGVDKLKAYRKELEGATGASSTMASVMRDTIQGRLNSLNSVIEGVKISIFALTSGPLAEVIDRMIEWVRVNESLIATNIGDFLLLIFNNIDQIVTVIGDIATGIAAFVALSIILKAIAVTLGLINIIMAANPIVLGILAAVAAVALLSGALDPIIDTLKSIGSGISNAFSAVSGLSGIFGFGDNDEAKQNGTSSQIVSPQERTARSIEEQRTTSAAEVTIRDDTGRAEVTRGKLGLGLSLQPSSAF